MNKMCWNLWFDDGKSVSSQITKAVTLHEVDMEHGIEYGGLQYYNDKLNNQVVNLNLVTSMNPWKNCSDCEERKKNE